MLTTSSVPLKTPGQILSTIANERSNKRVSRENVSVPKKNKHSTDITPIQIIVWRADGGKVGHVAVYLGDGNDYGRELLAICNTPLEVINQIANLPATAPLPSNPYISFYPGDVFHTLHQDMNPTPDGNSKTQINMTATQTVPVNNKMNLGTTPDAIIEILSLSRKDMLREFKFWEANPPTWDLWGSAINGTPNTKNCVSFAMLILEKGGLNEVMPSYTFVGRTGFGVLGFALGSASMALEIFRSLQKNKPVQINPEALLTITIAGILIAIPSVVIGGGMAGFVDGLYEGYDTGTAYPEGYFHPWLNRFVPGIGAILGGMINALCSAVGIDNATRHILTTPNHVQRLGERLAAYESKKHKLETPAPASTAPAVT